MSRLESPYMSILSSPVAFEQFELTAKRHLPVGADYSGAIAITKDSAHKGLLHKLFKVAQLIHNFLFKIGCDTDLCHAMVVLKRVDTGDINARDQLVVAHSVTAGLKTTKVNYLDYPDNDVTGMLVYRPKHEGLRNLLAKYGNQTAYTIEKNIPANAEPGAYASAQVSFSFIKMVLSFFYKPKVLESPHHRISKIAADLLMRRQLHNDKSTEKEGFLCSGYATSVLQGSMLICALKELDPTLDDASSVGGAVKFVGVTYGDRNALAARIHAKLMDETDPLHAFFNQNPILHLNPTYTISGFMAKKLDSHPVEPKPVIQEEYEKKS